MAVAEFDLIRRYFAVHAPQHPFNQLGIGDDCALLNIPSGHQLAVTADTMVENVHFFADADPELLGHKLLAVNLSDLAAMGAEPFAVTLALTLPKVDETWLQAFSRGFINLARQHNVDLVGGDTTSGPLTLTVQAMGVVPQGKALLRSGAQVGDLIYVTGPLGNAGLGLKLHQGVKCADPRLILRSFNQPRPRVAEGLALRGLANACIDISDGLAADLGHILESSGVGACLQWDSLPLSQQVQEYIEHSGNWRMPLTAGDDYELCFTVPANFTQALPAGCHYVGEIQTKAGLRIVRAGRVETFEAKGFEHFS
ncbi:MULTISPECIES: thiamine-phosphate kinase [Methylomonas]|uniref:Thiamine-monophosphate kinase n=2 Tax=Methylomonas TaxID=416 RepID=A0A140E671_9GAMM|nr:MULTISPECIES: thiamine-phosphate kinase [Methylomonas]AMK78895.1 thiamine-monophosphate kinase [Methylomonas denitrificans]OAI02166.1 thiamine-monophosphate kinase [Methylomonas methanica]TCV78241.1 thiamine-phosphate kinase [Methylomonas methanica]